MTPQTNCSVTVGEEIDLRCVNKIAQDSWGPKDTNVSSNGAQGVQWACRPRQWGRQGWGLRSLWSQETAP